jgi:predicted RNA-binding protein associated with RNAse of E/G family
MRPGDRHAIEVLWDTSWEDRGWYVNLQAPLVVRGVNFDTCDHALDVRILSDGAWHWKDEDDFAEAVALGILDEAEARLVRAEGERVIAARPWPTGWEKWRPPSDWAPLRLPSDWAALTG